jgi:S1-C subfamily serine protease
MKTLLVCIAVLLGSCCGMKLGSKVIDNNKGIVLLKGSTALFGYRATAFAIRRDGKGTILLTNKHACIDGAIITIKDTNSNEYSAEVIRTGTFDDLCLLHTDALLPVLKLADKDANYGDSVVVDGCGRGICGQLVTGYIGKYIEIKSEDVGIYDKEQLLTTPIYHGNSGSPVMDSSGKVVGIINLGVEDANTESIMVPVNVILRFLDNNNDVIQ